MTERYAASGLLAVISARLRREGEVVCAGGGVAPLAAALDSAVVVMRFGASWPMSSSKGRSVPIISTLSGMML